MPAHHFEDVTVKYEEPTSGGTHHREHNGEIKLLDNGYVYIPLESMLLPPTKIIEISDLPGLVPENEIRH